MKKIYILWLRQIKRYLRSHSRILGSLGQPVLLLFALGYGLGSVFKEAGMGNYLSFIAPGIISMSVVFTSISSGMEVIWDRQFGFLRQILVAPVSRLNILLGRTLGSATIATFQGCLIMVIATMLGFRPSSWWAFMFIIPCMLLLSVMFSSLAAAVASILNDMQGFQLILQFLIMPMFFLSGALYPLEGLPIILEFIVSINPLTYGVDAFRHILIGVGYYNFLTDLTVLAVLSGILLIVGDRLFGRMQV